jgi:hypothetical protein
MKLKKYFNVFGFLFKLKKAQGNHDLAIKELKNMLVDANKNRANEDPRKNDKTWQGYIEGVKGAIYRLEMSNSK